MKYYIVALVILLATCNLSAQKNDINIEKAKQLSSETNRRIMLVFKGSDWCAPCIKLEKEILETEAFKGLSKDVFITMIADFPRKKKNQLSAEKQKENGALAETYNPNGYFPYIVILSPQGEMLGSAGYEKASPQNYFNKLNAFK